LPLPRTSHRLFERTWRSTCPIRPRHSALRRWSGLAALAALCALIVGYAFVTDSNRVRQQAEAYLSRLVGGQAHVQSATLSLFEGLRLEGVTIRTPDQAEGANSPDAVLFTARSLSIDYNPLFLLLGRISATSIIAVDPHVRLTEDVQSGTWNIQRLRRLREPEPRTPTRFVPPEELPEIFLRNAQIEYGRLVEGVVVSRGSVGIEAQLRPAISAHHDPSAGDSGAYRFSVQTRGLSAEGEASPRATGVINLHEGNVQARLHDVDFFALADLLPRGWSEWWRQHEISGRLDVPEIRLNWNQLVTITAPDGTQERVPHFRAVVELDQAQIQGVPEEWLPAEEIAARREIAAAIEAALPRVTSPIARSALSQLEEQARLRPLRLRDVSGSFVFTHTGLRVNGLVGDFEGNRLRVDGIVNGYSPDAALSLVVQNADDAIALPPDVDYVGSLPRQVREIYQRFLPMGHCRLRLELHRPAAMAEGKPARPIVTGYVDVLDGTFTLDRFPYPVRNARGRLLLRYDRQTQLDQLVIENLRGIGLADGPNSRAQITVDGTVGPLTSYAGFDITVAGTDVSNEPELVAALPEAARQTIANFDPANHGRGAGNNGAAPPALSFAGDFRAHVMRPPGPRQRWVYRVDLDLRRMNGAFVAFPYPLMDATGRVSVFPDHVEIVDARTSRSITDSAGDARPPAEVRFGGRVDWGRRPGDPEQIARRPIRVDLEVTGRNVPTDEALLRALPEEALQQIAAYGLGGVADITARVFSDKQDKLSWDVNLDMSDGRFWPETGTFNLSDLHGQLRLLPGRVEMTNLTGRRGEGTVVIDGSVELTRTGIADARIAATNVMLDAAIYDLLPPAAKEAWNWLRPSGATDAQIIYRGPTALFMSGEEPSLGPELPEPEYEVILRPRGAGALPRAFPYALQNVEGMIRILPRRVELENLTADHVIGQDQAVAKLSLSGTGDLGEGENGVDLWQLQPRLLDVPIDQALLTAIPQGLRETLESLKAAGTVSADFERLAITVHPGTGPAELEPPIVATTRSALADSNLDVDFAVRLTTSDLSLDAGAPLSQVQGALSLNGKYELGKLEELAGAFVAQRFAMHGRAGSELRGTIASPRQSDTLTIGQLEAQIAGGQLAGTVTLAFSDEPEIPAKYFVEVTIREADVRKLIGEQPGRAADFAGRLTARLDLEGTFGEPATRRGRGEVVVEGQKLYDLPLVLGLLQVTTLALPLSEPFREATAAFNIDGPKVIFDHIALRASDMTMTGQGLLDFDTQQVDLSFTTSSAGWAAIPLVGDLMGVARNELLRIHVRGTLKSPEVSGSTLPTITSTIDEVFRRD
jgi:hypothetical protein